MQVAGKLLVRLGAIARKSTADPPPPHSVAFSPSPFDDLWRRAN